MKDDFKVGPAARRKFLEYGSGPQTVEELSELREYTAPADLHRANAGVSSNVGGVKHDAGKPQLSLVSRELIESLAKVRMYGAAKYGRGQWRQGFKYSRSIDAALRHLYAFASGEDTDPESGESHLMHCVANLEHLLHDTLYRPHNDDRDV